MVRSSNRGWVPRLKLEGQRIAAHSFRLQKLRVYALAMLYNTSSSRDRSFNGIYPAKPPENTGVEIPFNGISMLRIRFLRFSSSTHFRKNPRHQQTPSSPCSPLPCTQTSALAFLPVFALPALVLPAPTQHSCSARRSQPQPPST